MTMRNAPFFVALTMVTSVAQTVRGQSPQGPVYEVSRTNVLLKVDGKLDDPSWARARSIGKFVLNSDGSSSLHETEAKVLYDDKFLHFSFRPIISGPPLNSGISTFRKKKLSRCFSKPIHVNPATSSWR
jgi:hypothetical protein